MKLSKLAMEDRALIPAQSGVKRVEEVSARRRSRRQAYRISKRDLQWLHFLKHREHMGNRRDRPPSYRKPRCPSAGTHIHSRQPFHMCHESALRVSRQETAEADNRPSFRRLSELQLQSYRRSKSHPRRDRRVIALHRQLSPWRRDLHTDRQNMSTRSRERIAPPLTLVRQRV